MRGVTAAVGEPFVAEPALERLVTCVDPDVFLENRDCQVEQSPLI